ncbi:hypothetical protein [Acinetobacter sp. ANC 3791]|uniref:hypothetical protein n=1 Tax=Acinetobacter sp. ANC 3791 TaxID=2529836 RepID=UPI00103D5AC3|nr:hypothetical protein [Acinetobacter sp. ANC 3791]TCB86322.1 hypothetical protein E0H90_00410 [Acinetobacter sp. ANC 3791]
MQKPNIQTKENRTEISAVRFSTLEKQLLEEIAFKAKKKPAVLIREAVLQVYPELRKAAKKHSKDE